MTKFAPLRFMLFVVLLLGMTALTGAGILAAQPQPQPAEPATPVAGGDINDASHPPLVGGSPAGPKVGPRVNPAPPNPGTASQSAVDAPTINVWYGNTQTFGQNGDPQKWVNIVGNVSSTVNILSLTYKLNNGPARVISVGPNSSRLEKKGDFNVDIDYTDLLTGANSVAITATDIGGGSTTANVTVNYQPKAGGWAPGTYTIDFGTAAQVNQVAQVVDGNWILEGGKARPAAGLIGFDRLIAVGDISWRDYTVTVPVTVHSITQNKSPAFGMILRWPGHFDNENGLQPFPGWRRLGAMAWYRYQSATSTEGLQLLGNGGLNNGSAPFTLQLGKTYMLKARVVSNADPTKTANYSFKVWDAATTEPSTWNIEATGLTGEPRNGSIVLVAHHSDVSFGNVTVDLASIEPKPELTIQTSGTGNGTVTANPQKATYRFGEDVTLTASPASGSTFVNWQGDATGTSATSSVEMFADRTVTAVFADPSVNTPISDDFSGCQLNTGLWAFTNPLNDATVVLNGSQAEIAIPGGTAHDFWPTSNFNAPRLMQFADNSDFTIEAKFDSTMNSRNQLQGILIAGEGNKYIRFAYIHNGSSYRLQVHTIADGTATARYDQPVTMTGPMHLKIQRLGKYWLTNYFPNPSNGWGTVVNFEFEMPVNSYGVVAGNSGGNPAFTSKVDYFFNSNSPISPEDNSRKLNITTTGSGSVTKSPEKDSYACDEVVTLTAVPAQGYKFSSWGGDLTGTTNPATLVMNQTKNVTANFATDEQFTVTTSAVGGGTVTKSPDKPTYSAGEQVVITATPQIGNLFSNWSGGATGSANPLTVTVNSNLAIVGNFTVAPARVLTLNVSGSGTVTKNPDKPAYLHGESVTLTAAAAANWNFAGWGGDATGTTSTTTIVMDADKTVSATFLENIHTLTTAVDPAGSGSITVSPPKAAYYDGEIVTLTAMPGAGNDFAGWSGDLAGMTNPAQLVMNKDSSVTASFIPAGSFHVEIVLNGLGTVLTNPPGTEFPYGTELTLTALPGTDMEFISWSGDLEGTDNPITFTVTQDVVITANFGSEGIYSLTLVPGENGTIEATPVRPLYGQNEQVTLTAFPESGYMFAGWGGDATGTTNPTVLTMTKDMVVSATFIEAPLYNVNVALNGEGTVTIDPPGTQFYAGTTINLTAVPGGDSVFIGWSGDASSNANPLSLVVDGEKNIVANFAAPMPVVSDDFSGCGTLNSMWAWNDPLGGGDYSVNGSQLRITVPPDVNYGIWTAGNNSARLMQEIANTNFEVFVKFDSIPNQLSQTQGVLIEVNENEFVRIDYYYDGSNLRFFGGTVANGSSRNRFNEIISLAGVTSPQLSIRVQRNGETLRNFYRLSEDGQWTGFKGSNFRYPIDPTQATIGLGVFAASPMSGGVAAGHTAVVDYFFNSSAPITPEDGAAPSITLNKVGQGTVTMTPAAGPYTCGQQVQLSATPAAGWRFQNYSGDLNGSSPNQTVTVSKNHVITATFVLLDAPTSYTLMMPVVLRR